MRHRLHSICPYFAMFPEEFVAQQVTEFTCTGDLVFDPFCGRGTAVFESLLRDRDAAGVDVNPVAACVAGAKADPPQLNEALDRLSDLERQFSASPRDPETRDEFFRCCYHPETLAQVEFLRRRLAWQSSRTDRFIAAVVLGCLHGESHKSPNYLSNRMPRTISTKPEFSIRWWRSQSLTPPRREAFRILEGWIRYRLGHEGHPLPARRGHISLLDARKASDALPELTGRVDLVVTSPPYLNTTNFREDQWLRLWFLGGPTRPNATAGNDDRYRSEPPYWLFLTEVWRGCASLMKAGTVIVVRIGGRQLDYASLPQNLLKSLQNGMEGFQIDAIRDEVKTEIVNRQTQSFRPGSIAKRFEYDFVFGLR